MSASNCRQSSRAIACVDASGRRAGRSSSTAASVCSSLCAWPNRTGQWNSMRYALACGQLRPGFLADVVLIDGNPLSNLSLLTEPAKVQLVMKEGVIHKDCSTPVQDDAALHLPGADRPLQEEGVREVLAAAGR
jgi:hypothetical protein